MLDATDIAEPKATAASQPYEQAAASGDLGLPSLPPRYSEAMNAFFRRRDSLQFRVLGRGLRLAPTWLADEPEIHDPYTVTLKVDTDQAELVVSQGMLQFLLTELDPGLSLERLDSEKAALVVEHALTEPLTAIEQTAGCLISVITVSKGAGKWTGPDRPSLPVVLYIERMGIAWSMLRLSADDVARLGAVLQRSAGPAPRPADLHLDVRVRVAAADMSLAEIASIEPGDIILPDRLAPQPAGAVAVIGEHLVAPAEITPAGCRIGARIRRGRGSPLEWSLTPRTSAHQPVENGTVGDITVPLMIEAGHCDMPLTAIQALTAGSVVPLEQAGSGDVADLDLVVNGRVIGRGSRVRIGDSTGVRVTRLLGRSL